MKGFIRLMVLGLIVGFLSGCATSQTEEDSLTTESYSDGGAAPTTSEKDDFSDMNNSAEEASTSSTETTEPAKRDDDLALEDEVNQASGSDQQFAQDDVDKEAKKEMQPQAPAEQTAEQNPQQQEELLVESPVAQEPPPPVVDEPLAAEPPAVVEVAPSTPEVTEKPVEITGLKYKANDAGGTVVIESSAPVTYTTRSNPDLKQYVIEISNSVLPKKLKRTLNTRDIKGAVGAIDAYQSAGSQVARIVIQMRDGFAEPTVQQEGNSLLVVAAGVPDGSVAEAAGPAQISEGGDEGSLAQGETEMNVELNSNKILASQSLQEYLSGNTKFYGRKISIETSNIDVRDALKFITDESGVNMVITDEVKGNVSLKLRQVPWDQALVMIMKARRLGYSRQGNILRIVPLDELKKEEDDATKLAQAKRDIEPLKVRAFAISYAKVEDLDKKIKEFLSARGKVISDARTNTVVVTDIEEGLARVSKLIQGLDSAPPQVLIEGKIVEASDSFSRSVGVNWGFTGADKVIGGGTQGPINMTPNLTIGGNNRTAGGLDFGVQVGVLDLLGDLNASLNLFEQEEKVKVLSSPRIVTLSNETANITQSNELPVKQVTQTNGATTTSYTFKKLDLKLEVTPQITSEGTVIMKVGVSRDVQGAAVSTTDEQFSVNKREANTKVIVKNGQTAVIGGIYRADTTEGVTGVPWLKDIPVLGYLFKANSTRRQRSELLIFLTPRILAQAETTPSHTMEGGNDLQ